jgi:hypothetical protein
MRFRFTIRDLLWLTALVALAVALGVTLAENRRLHNPPALKPQVIAQAGPLTISGNKDFPENLYCQIMIEKNPLPCLSIMGKNETIEAVSVLADIDRGVRLDRNEAKDSYRLLLNGKDQNKNDFLLWDLNFDGNWDVKLTPSGEAKGSYIWLVDKWVRVEEMDGIKSGQPKAKNAESQFIFDGSWRIAP